MERVQRAACIAERHAADTEREQTKGGKLVERAGFARRVRDERDGAVGGDQDVLHFKVAGARALQAHDVPGVEQGRLTGRENHHPCIRGAGREPLHLAVFPERAAAAEPGAVGRARAPLPAAGDAVVVALDDRAAHRRKNAAGDGHRIGVDFLGKNRFHIGRVEGRGGGDHRAPAGTRIGAGDRLGDLDDLARCGFQAAEAFRRHHPKNTGSGQLLRKIRRQAAHLFHFSGAGSEFGQQWLHSGDGVVGLDGIRHAGKLALFRCASKCPFGDSRRVSIAGLLPGA